MTNFPRLGKLEKDSEMGCLFSEPVPVPLLGDDEYEFIIDGYEDDDQKEEFHQAVENFLSLGQDALRSAEPALIAYLEDCRSDHEPGDDEYIELKSPSDIWDHIHLGEEPTVSRRDYGDKKVYISLECNCDWATEHGLQIVFKEGKTINKIGEFDGHLTNSDAYDREEFEDKIYVSLQDIEE